MAAAARRPERNPVEKRAEWIAKHYPRTVVVDALAAWAEAVGADAQVHRLRTMALYEPVENSLKLLDLIVKERPQLRTTIYDAYLPWVAKTLNEKHKLLLRVHRDRAAASPHDHALQRIAASRDYGELLHARSSDPHSRPLSMEAIDGYTLLRDAIIHRFGVIGRWAAQDGVDLGPLSFDDAWDGAYAWINVEQPGATQQPHGDIVYRWPDGWTIRELKTQADLNFEGKMMGHCVGSYEAGDATRRMFSLRDPKNRPHVTMEWLTEYGYVNQLRGRGNDIPAPKYTARIAEFRNQTLPTDVPVAVPVPASDLVRQNAKYFDGRYLLPEDPNLMRDQIVEIWGGNVYVGLEDVDEAIEDQRQELLDRGYSEAGVTGHLRRKFQPSNVMSVDIPSWYEWWFARRGPGMGLLDNEDELVQAVRRAVDDAQGKPIFAALREPTGKRV